MYNEKKTNAHLIDSLYYTVLYLSLVHVSTPKRRPQGALTQCLLSYINVFMKFWCVAEFCLLGLYYFNLCTVHKHVSVT